jgi:hypothetical protein
MFWTTVKVIEWVFAAAQVELVQLNDVQQQASEVRGNCCFLLSEIITD